MSLPYRPLFPSQKFLHGRFNSRQVAPNLRQLILDHNFFQTETFSGFAKKSNALSDHGSSPNTDHVVYSKQTKFGIEFRFPALDLYFNAFNFYSQIIHTIQGLSVIIFIILENKGLQGIYTNSKKLSAKRNDFQL